MVGVPVPAPSRSPSAWRARSPRWRRSPPPRAHRLGRDRHAAWGQGPGGGLARPVRAASGRSPRARRSGFSRRRSPTSAWAASSSARVQPGHPAAARPRGARAPAATARPSRRWSDRPFTTTAAGAARRGRDVRGAWGRGGWLAVSRSPSPPVPFLHRRCAWTAWPRPATSRSPRSGSASRPGSAACRRSRRARSSASAPIAAAPPRRAAGPRRRSSPGRPWPRPPASPSGAAVVRFRPVRGRRHLDRHLAVRAGAGRVSPLSGGAAGPSRPTDAGLVDRDAALRARARAGRARRSRSPDAVVELVRPRAPRPRGSVRRRGRALGDRPASCACRLRGRRGGRRASRAASTSSSTGSRTRGRTGRVLSFTLLVAVLIGGAATALGPVVGVACSSAPSRSRRTRSRG